MPHMWADIHSGPDRETQRSVRAGVCLNLAKRGLADNGAFVTRLLPSTACSDVGRVGRIDALITHCHQVVILPRSLLESVLIIGLVFGAQSQGKLNFLAIFFVWQRTSASLFGKLHEDLKRQVPTYVCVRSFL